MNEAIDATTAFAPIWRLKWLILAVGLVVAVATYAYYKTEATVFSSTAQLFVGGAEEGGVVNGLLPTKRAVSGRAIETPVPSVSMSFWVEVRGLLLTVKASAALFPASNATQNAKTDLKIIRVP